MKVFGKEYKTEVVEFEDLSKEDFIHRRLRYKVDEKLYEYNYSGGPSLKTTTVHEIDEVLDNAILRYDAYGSWSHNSYLEEIGRQLSVTARSLEKAKVRPKLRYHNFDVLVGEDQTDEFIIHCDNGAELHLKREEGKVILHNIQSGRVDMIENKIVFYEKA